MKIKKSQLRKMVRETIYEETTSLAHEQKQLAEYVDLYLEETPFLQEHRKINSRKALLEFFGPFKKLGVKDLEKMGREKETRVTKQAGAQATKKLAGLVKSTEAARKKLASTKLTNVAAMQVGLESYVERLIDLYQAIKGEEVDASLQTKLSKPFAVAAYTLQSLSASLTDAANDLFSAVPKSSGVYSAGREAQSIEKQQQSFMMTPAQRVGQAAKDVWGMSSRGMGSGRRPPR